MSARGGPRTRAAGTGPSHSRELIKVTGIAAGGAGVGRLDDGRAVFVHRTAPGDLVEVERTSERRRWARARLVRLLEPGPGRRSAPCPHYERCGGCTIQHLDRPFQLDAKTRIVAEALRRIGGIDADIPDIVATGDEFHYRNRVSFTVLRLGTGRVIAGFHELERPDRVVDIDRRCLLPEPAIGRAWHELRARWGRDANRLPAGRTLRLTLRATGAGDVSLLIEDGFGDGRPDELIERVRGLTSIWKKAAGSTVLLAGTTGMRESGDSESPVVAGAPFRQVNREVAALLEDHAARCAGDVTGRRVIDAYCGVGSLAGRLARQGARVTGIDIDNDAVAEARRAFGDAVEFVGGRVEARIGSALPADLVIVNPPRAGLDATVCEALVQSMPGRLLYISCDPATLARDLARLSPAFVLRSVRCFDLFPQTAHVESLAELACATS